MARADNTPLGDTVGRLVGDQLRAGSVVDEVRRKVHAWRDPRAKALRARKRAVRTTTTWGGLTALSGGGAALDFATHPGLLGYGLAGFGALTLMVTVNAGRRTRRLYKVPLPEPAREPIRLPSEASAAHEPMRRLAVAEQTLHELLGELRDPQGAIPQVPGSTLESTSDAARTATEQLRGLAGQIQAVERSRSAVSADDRTAFDQPIETLRERLVTGVDEYGRLVAAAARTVAACADHSRSHAVGEATDELSGLADALHELSGRSARR